MEEVQLYPITTTTINNTTNNKLNKFVVVFLPIIIITLFCVVIFQSYQVELIKSVLKKEKLNTLNFTALALTGNGQVVCGKRRYLAIRGWILHYQYGDISFSEGRNIEIKVSGFYYIQLQMFFFQNGKLFRVVNKEKAVMDIAVVNRRSGKRILAVTISLNSCINACTKHTSGISYLRNGSILAVNTATPGIYFRMIREKTQFSVFLLKQI